MNKKTKRILIIIVVIVLVLLAVSGRLDNVLVALSGTSADTSDSADNASLSTTEASAEDSAENSADQPQSNASSSYTGPVLPDESLSGKDLFSDGIAVVKLDFGIDGDTAAFIVNGKSYHVRMLAIDTPEVDENLRQLDPWGKAASNYTKSTLRNAKQIVLELDPDSDTFDKYGRVLAWVWVDGELHNYNVVAEGLAEVAYLYGNYLYTGELKNAEDDAKAAGIKIWGEKDPDYDY